LYIYKKFLDKLSPESFIKKIKENFEKKNQIPESRREEFKKYYNTSLSEGLLKLLLGGNHSFTMYFKQKEQLLDIYK
jgi:hypothetical protein